MSQTDETPRGDPWMAFGYVVSGVLLYGVVGWLLDRWWDTSFMVAVGILVGAGLGLYQTFARFRVTEASTSAPSASQAPPEPPRQSSPQSPAPPE